VQYTLTLTDETGSPITEPIEASNVEGYHRIEFVHDGIVYTVDIEPGD